MQVEAMMKDAAASAEDLVSQRTAAKPAADAEAAKLPTPLYMIPKWGLMLTSQYMLAACRLKL